MDRPDWNREGRDWPNRDSSRFVSAAGMRWHVQMAGEGPVVLLLHGTGAATHSWRDLFPLLARRFAVVAPDLPGHGFSAMPPASGLSLAGMSKRIAALLDVMELAPDVIVGHSAGAAVAIQLATSARTTPRLIVSLNGALKPIRGAGIFSPLAKLLFLNPLAPRLFSWRAHASGATERLLRNTGSSIDGRGLALYERLFRCAGHVEATLGMMAAWDLDAMPERLRRCQSDLLLVAATGDRAVPPSDAQALAACASKARVIMLPSGGHLAHEEDPAGIAELVIDSAATTGIL